MVVKVIVFSLLCATVAHSNNLRKDRAYWKTLGENELKEALSLQWNLDVAKNVIMFVGDGLGPNTITASRIQKGGEGHRLSFEEFPHMGLMKVYSADLMVPDAASTGTAMVSGYKVNSRTIGVDANVVHNDCEASLNPNNRVESLAALALRDGRSAGFVTNMRVTHSTLSPLYAHTPNANWECDASVPQGSPCKDIARQMIEDWPGRDLNVILGGGRQGIITGAQGTEEDPLSRWGCSRVDGRDLFDSYRLDKTRRGLLHSIVSNKDELQKAAEDTDYLFGVFRNENLPYEFQRPENTPSLVDMTEAALKVLQRNKKGYFLLVEGGNIDMGHHRGRARTAIDEAVYFDEAVKMAINMTDERDTLIIVSANMMHSLSINGHPARGSDLFGTVGPSRFDHLNYTVLSYATGGPGSKQFEIKTEDNEQTVVRRDPTKENTTSFFYEQVAGITLEENYHGGGDVTVYAKGPYAHLFHNVHEQHYLFYAISYAAQLGEYAT
ncbi:alkaline phosphatase [Pieris rapae]|uniref:alkaline phosphatase n=1 Tax=Pieris rapae TaxID=64459 RepID=UPI001E27C0A5|nr:alkaline phosphatase [Pieris rapae]